MLGVIVVDFGRDWLSIQEAAEPKSNPILKVLGCITSQSILPGEIDAVVILPGRDAADDSAVIKW